MKKLKLVLLMLSLFAVTFAQAQTKKAEKKTPPTTIDATNLLDVQTDLYKNYMGDSLSSGKDPKSINGFLELLEESDLSAEEKKQARDFYHEYTANPSDQKLDSLQMIIKKSKPDTIK